MNKNSIGWKCPVCGKGNSPFALKCGHCPNIEAGPPWTDKNRIDGCNCPDFCRFHTKIGIKYDTRAN